MGKHFSGERFSAAYLVVDASTAIYPNGAFLKEATPFAGLDSRLAGWFRIGSQCQFNLTQIPKMGESCSSSSSCSCSTCGTSAPKREPDPAAIILFHHCDRGVRRILENEQEHEDEHDFSSSAFEFTLGADRLQGASLAGSLGVPYENRRDQAEGCRERHPGSRHSAIPGHMDKISANGRSEPPKNCGG